MKVLATNLNMLKEEGGKGSMTSWESEGNLSEDTLG